VRTRTVIISAIGLALTVVAASLWQPAFSQTTKPAAVAAAPGAFTGTWAVSPQGSGARFNGQTLRQIVHTSISGTAARIQLSNALGSQPLTISDVHIARRTNGSSIDAGSDRRVTFGGAASVTIPVGGTAVSDGAAFTVDALSDVAVSFYLPQQTGNATAHSNFGSQNNYSANGDVAGSATLPNPQNMGDYFFLVNLDVQNAAAQGAVVALGASITNGNGTPSDANRRWPNDLAVRLNQAGRTIGVLNQGISGNGVLGGGESAAGRFERDVLSQPNVKWVIFSDNPINELGGNPNAGPQIIAAVSDLITRAHNRGIKFICSTLTPFEGAFYWTPTGETGRAAYNDFVRKPGGPCDGIVDQDTATHDPAHPTKFRPDLHIGDFLHPNVAGLQAIANAVDLNLFGQSSGGTTPPSRVISLRAHANGNLVTAESGGAAPLIANRTAPGFWERFKEMDLGGGRVALLAEANNHYVSAADNGKAPLIASSSAVGPAETFELIHNADGSIALRATINAKVVCADGGGTSPLIANRDRVFAWEEFEVITT
jgi:lysophospholipase L1-like esterase